ncbi:phosphopantetheine-binding protein [Blastococcus sp. CCUG 61487]|uniref:acyl carrier protein n=1 Tax=Blastococcus sp. CCUG 61487 TaxID=1840703 RepID=UPI00113C5844|nr:phosphopantetheine-binding protein [Blastococcus sp. CCUG 61487]TKJ18874.1 hypothetical protein A6V29_10845 [Blastococcus sp. CCUG 61487]
MNPEPRPDVEARVAACLHRALPPALRTVEVEEGTLLQSLGMDSLSFLEFLVALEDEFTLNLSEDVLKLNQVKTFGDVVELVTMVAEAQGKDLADHA